MAPPSRGHRCVVRFVCWVALFTASHAKAAQHPVPLDPKTDSAKCVECHEEKTKGKSVHSAMALGCTSCHEIRVNRDITRVKLITTTPQALCITCHSDKNSAQIKGRVHPPNSRNCLSCHDPHSSDYKNQLLKGTSEATKDQNLCLSCHAERFNIATTGSRHAALDMGCDTCHVVHKSGPAGKVDFDEHLTKAPPALCLDCHDAGDASLIKAHNGQPFGNANCIQCHDPHQSAQPKLMQAFLHFPFANKMCDSCHASPNKGKVSLINTDTRALCLTCHSDVGEKMDKAKVQHPGALGECTSCHNPHGGRTSGFLQPDPVQACLACHSDQSEQMKKAHLHQPAFVQGCATCHTPHGGDNDHLLRTADVNGLCLECHSPDREPKELKDEKMWAIFDGSVKLPQDYFKRTPIIALKYGAGHPTEQHPVSGPSEPHNAKSPAMTCLSCHQPHSSAHDNLLVKDQAMGTQFCSSCHKVSTFFQ